MKRFGFYAEVIANFLVLGILANIGLDIDLDFAYFWCTIIALSKIYERQN